MENVEYKGYKVTGFVNKKIKAFIKENTFHTNYNEIAGSKIHLRYEPPVSFIFSDYDTMTKFIDENPR